MQAFFKGTALILTRPGLWGYVWKPMLAGLVVYLTILAAGVFFVVPYIVGLTGPEGYFASLLDYAGKLGLTVAWVFFAAPIYLFISGLYSSLLWERLAERVEIELYGFAPSRPVGCFTYILDAIARVAFAALLVICGCLCFWAGPVAGLVVAGWLSLLDFTCAAYLRRGIAFNRQFTDVWKAPGALGFAVCCGIVSLLPFVFIMMLPAMVAGGTILCRERYSAR